MDKLSRVKCNIGTSTCRRCRRVITLYKILTLFRKCIRGPGQVKYGVIYGGADSSLTFSGARKMTRPRLCAALAVPLEARSLQVLRFFLKAASAFRVSLFRGPYYLLQPSRIFDYHLLPEEIGKNNCPRSVF